MKQLIVTADDVGLHRGMTAGAIRAHRQGIVTACSVVANGGAFDDAIEQLRDTPTLEVGVHLTLVEEQPLTAMTFPRSHASFVPRYLAGRISIAAIERELRAQVDRVAVTGLRITHLDGHQHLHMLPAIFEVAQRIAIDHGIGYIRVVNDRGGRGGLARRASITALSAMRYLSRPSIEHPTRTIGVMEAGHLTADTLVRLICHVEGLTELVTHPGLDVDGYAWQYDWDAETSALCDPRLREALERNDVELYKPSGATSGTSPNER